MRIINWGGIISHLFVPDAEGKLADIVLGFEEPSDYLEEHPYFGAIVGRYANRINKGHFIYKGISYQLTINQGAHHLHGGIKGFDKVFWDCTQVDKKNLILRYISPDAEQGYPGTLRVQVKYSLSEHNEFRIDYKATTDRSTFLNLSQHTYFNLSGIPKETIAQHELTIDADYFTEIDDELIPTGKLVPVDARMNFKFRRNIGLYLNELKHGYDHNYVLRNTKGLKKVADLFHSTSGRLMEVYTTQPGLQFYTGNFLDGSIIGKGKEAYQKHRGLCLETQHFPDSPNHKEFPSTLLRPGDLYHQTTIYKFSALTPHHPDQSQW